MAGRALREVQIGTKLMESEDEIIFAERCTVRYECPNGHEFKVPLSIEAIPPANWECCYGTKGKLIGGAPEDEETKPAKPVRTH